MKSRKMTMTKSATADFEGLSPLTDAAVDCMSIETKMSHDCPNIIVSERGRPSS